MTDIEIIIKLPDYIVENLKRGVWGLVAHSGDGERMFVITEWEEKEGGK